MILQEKLFLFCFYFILLDKVHKPAGNPTTQMVENVKNNGYHGDDVFYTPDLDISGSPPLFLKYSESFHMRGIRRSAEWPSESQKYSGPLLLEKPDKKYSAAHLKALFSQYMAPHLHLRRFWSEINDFF